MKDTPNQFEPDDDEELLVLVRPVYYAKRSNCDFTKAALQQDYDLEHARVWELLMGARCPYYAYDTLRYMFASCEDLTLESIFSPGLQPPQENSQEFLTQCHRAIYAPPLVTHWTHDHMAQLQEWDNRPWISLPPFIGHVHEERSKKDKHGKSKLQVSVRERVVRMLIFIFFVSAGFFVLKMKSCSAFTL